MLKPTKEAVAAPTITLSNGMAVTYRAGRFHPYEVSFATNPLNGFATRWADDGWCGLGSYVDLTPADRLALATLTESK